MANTKKKSNKELYHEGFAQRNPDIDINDEEAYYGRLNERAADMQKMREMNDNFNKSISNSPLFTDAIMASQQNPDFDIILWAIENGRLDLESLQNDPEYAKKLADANKKALARRAKDKEIADKFESNFNASLEAMKSKAQEMGHDEETFKNTFAKYYQACFDATEGNFYPEMYEFIAKGMSHDADVTNARNEGQAAGLNTKVSDSLRKMPAAREGNAGMQTPKQESRPTRNTAENMFGL